MTMLTIRAPLHREAELAWVSSVIFHHWLGLNYRLETHEQSCVEVHVGQKCVRWQDVFLAKADRCWLQPDSLPPKDTLTWVMPDAALRTSVGQTHLANIFGDGHFEVRSDAVHLPIDVTGSIFFLLSRYEEAICGATLDKHGRFPGRSTVVHRAGLALRPLVDEWVELLWWSLKIIAPQLQRKPRTPTVWVSCDVDAPYSPGSKSWPLAMRQTASDIWNHRSPRQAGKTLLNAVASRAGITRFDSYDTFNWILDVNEESGNRVSFFFLSVLNPAHIDGCYELGEPRVSKLMRSMLLRGHEIGLHGSYSSADQPDKLASELDRLRLAILQAGGNPLHIGGRQHYLRWRMDITAHALDSAGLVYDSTLGFPDIAGFRCGTCHTFPIFDLFRSEQLSLLERPLVLMDVTVTSPTYLNHGHGEDARNLMMNLRESCRRFGGEFSLLWHNSNSIDPAARELYKALIRPL